MPRLLLVFLALVSVFASPGCGPSGPASTDTLSSALPDLDARVEFLERYVQFRRAYEVLDFSIRFRGSEGGFLDVPGPSEWDIRLVAKVPAAEIDDWVPAGVAAGPPPDFSDWVAAGPGTAPGTPLDWRDAVPATLPLAGVDEWYDGGGRIVGLDRDERVVVYRLFTR